MEDAQSPDGPIRDAVHLCIDMQNIFAPGGLRETPRMEKVLPGIASIVARHQGRRAALQAAVVALRFAASAVFATSAIQPEATGRIASLKS